MEDTHPSRERLAAFDRGLLSRREQTEVEQHVVGCTSCCQTLENFDDDELIVLIKAAVTPAVSPSTVYGGNGGADTPGGKATAVPQLPEALRDHPRYRIVGLLGAGGMGAVFQAEHKLMERPVALKILNPELLQRPGAVLRFRQEIKAASQLSHPNIVTAYDADQAGDVHFLVMELVEGKPLDHQIEPGKPLAVAAACSWIYQAARGLQHAHERGMVHRDIKPGNLMLSTSPLSPGGERGFGVVKILDFGLARVVSEFTATTLTASGSLVGTPDYIAPEQARDPRRIDIRADIYSLGCTLYHLLAGQVPHPGGSVLQKLMAHQETRPRPLTDFRRDLPPGLVAVVERMMAKDPNERYQTPAEVIAALSPFAGEPVAARGDSGRSRPPLAVLLTLTGIVGAVALIVAGIAYWGSHPSPPGSQPALQPPTEATVPVAVRPTERQTQIIFPDNRPARDAAVAWCRDHHRFEPTNNFPNAIGKKLDTELRDGIGVMMTLSGGLLASNKGTMLTIRDGHFQPFELLPAESAGMGPSDIRTITMMNPRDPRRLPEAVRISGLTLLQTGVIPAGEPIRGSVRYQIVGKPDEYYSLRVVGYQGSMRRTTHKKLQLENGPPGVCTFTIRAEEGGEMFGPVLLYAEVGVDVRLKDGKPVGMTVVSNTLTTLAHVEMPAKPAPEK